MKCIIGFLINTNVSRMLEVDLDPGIHFRVDTQGIPLRRSEGYIHLTPEGTSVVDSTILESVQKECWVREVEVSYVAPSEERDQVSASLKIKSASLFELLEMI